MIKPTLSKIARIITMTSIGLLASISVADASTWVGGNGGNPNSSSSAAGDATSDDAEAASDDAGASE